MASLCVLESVHASSRALFSVAWEFLVPPTTVLGLDVFLADVVVVVVVGALLEEFVSVLSDVGTVGSVDDDDCLLMVVLMCFVLFVGLFSLWS